MNIFITGASGFIGSVLLECLLNRMSKRDRIFMLHRNMKGHADKRIRLLSGDLESIEKFKNEIEQSDYIFHLAANAIYGSGTDYELINFFPTRKIVDIIKKNKRDQHLIFASTIGAVDRHKSDRCDAPLGINSIPSPTSDYGKSKLKSEEYIITSGIRYTIIRPTWVYGRNMRSNSHINQFVTMVYNNSMVQRIAFPGKVSLIHVIDLCEAMLNCINNERAINRIYFAETEALSLGEIFKLINVNLKGREIKQAPLPSFRFIIGRIHHFIPLSLSNLFVDYLYAKDPSFRNDLLKGIRVKKFSKYVEDVVSTNLNVSGKWVITGANSGIGLALAKKLDAKRKKLILIDINLENLKGFSHQQIIQADLSVKNQVENLAEVLADERIYCLINNAGIGFRKTFDDISFNEIDRIISVNIIAPLLLVKKLLPGLKTKGSRIVNIASSIAYNPLPFMLMYSSTKAFISNWSESLTYELKDTNHVLTFSPSGTNTNFQKSSGVKSTKSGKGLLNPEFVAEKIIDAVSSNKRVVILGLSTKILLLVSKFLPRGFNITLWGRLFEKLR